MSSSATEALAGKKKPAKKLKEIRTRKGKSGGFIHEHHFSGGEHEPEEHVSPDAQAMLQHMMANMGGGASAAPAPAADPDAGQAAPATAPAGPPGM